jgi:diguanylate cyclase (GGDEF)-like protein
VDAVGDPDRSAAGRFRALCELSQEMALVDDEPSIYALVLDSARRVLDFYNCAILRIDSDARELVIVEQYGYPDETLGMRLPLAGERGISRWVALHGERLYVPDVHEDPRYVSGVPAARSELAVPIRIRDRTIGVINVESDRVDGFDRDDALLLEALASQLALAIELGHARADLERLTYTDALTGAFNRRYLERVLPTEKERAERFDHPIGLLMFDLDGFKEINDHFGHAYGDRVLVAFSDALTRIVRRIDVVVRYGGDEFLVVLLETDTAGAALAADRIRAEVEKALNASSLVAPGWTIRVSVGIAVRMPGDDVTEKIRESDQAMYADKQRRAEERHPLAEAP